jgi:hypothetical protein
MVRIVCLLCTLFALQITPLEAARRSSVPARPGGAANGLRVSRSHGSHGPMNDLTTKFGSNPTRSSGTLDLRASETEFNRDSTTASDSSCTCRPNIPLEIAASSLIVGVLEYEITRDFFDNTVRGQHGGPALIVPGLFLYMVSLAPVAEWTSSCEANAWNTLWIGLISHAVCTLGYGIAYGSSHVLNINKFIWPEYLALGVAPAVLTSVWYNRFLHPSEKEKNSDQGMYLLPSVNGSKSMSLSFGMRF